MSAQQSKGGDAGTLGIGGASSESMAETGGSGGENLTKPRKEESAGNRQSASDTKRQGDALQHAVDAASTPEGAGTAATATGPGAQDTRSQQAGIQQNGLGTPETGGNQSPEDLAPRSRQ